MSDSCDGARSLGRVRTIVKHSAIAWVTDFRPLGRDVLVRLASPWQARPGELLDYELNRSAGEKSRWHGVDVVFNREIGLEDALALDGGEGLSPVGLRFVLAALAREPRRLGEVFSPATSRALKRQVLETESFPLPRKLVEACLQHPALRGAARRRLGAGPLDAEALRALLAERGKPAAEAAVWKRVREEAPELLRAPLDLPASGLAERVAGWRRELDEPWLLLQLPPEAAAAAALDLLAAGLFAAEPADPELAAALEARFGERECEILRAALLDPRRRERGADPLGGLGERPTLVRVLEAHADHPAVGAEVRKRLLGGAKVEPTLALRLLLEGAGGPERPRLLAALPDLPAEAVAELPAERLLEWFEASRELSDTSAARRLQRWLGGFAPIAVQLEEWIAEERRRDAALAALASAPAFSRGLVQRLLGTPMDAELRVALAVAIGERSPERWSERYLLGDDEAALWREAGARL